MNKTLFNLTLGILCGTSFSSWAEEKSMQTRQHIVPNPKVDSIGFLIDVKASAAAREGRVITQEQFLKMAAEEGTIVLDARSADKFAMLHVVGAKNLPFTDFTQDSLAQLIPKKEARVLIYCNNNFDNAPVAMPAKSVRAALNLSTLVSLRSYGYINVYELGGYIDVNKSTLPLEGTEAPMKTAPKK